MNRHFLIQMIFVSVLYYTGNVSHGEFAENVWNNSSKFENEADLHSQFKDFVIRFNRSYLNDPKEYNKRKYIFKVRLRFIGRLAHFQVLSNNFLSNGC